MYRSGKKACFPPAGIHQWASFISECGLTLPRALLTLNLVQSHFFLCSDVQVADLQSESEDLRKQLEEQRAKCEAIEKRENEKQQLEEKKHNEEIQFLKSTNQQLKV